MGYTALAVRDGAVLSGSAPSPRNGSRWVFGAMVAEGGYYRALLENSVLDSLDFFEPGRETEERFRHAGKPCRRRPLSALPEAGRVERYDAILTEFSEAEVWALRARHFPSASVVALTHAMNMQFSLLRVVAAARWGLYKPHDAIVCSSETSRRTMTNMFELARESRARKTPVGNFPRLAVIPLGVEPPPAESGRAEARKALGFKPGDVVLLSFGRLTMVDKTDYIAALVPLARLLRRVRPASVKVVFAGVDAEGLAPILRKFAAGMGLGNAVSVRADPSFEERARLYAAADVFFSLADNIQETFGLTLLEAMARGLPVVASDWGGYRDIVRHGETGLLVKTRWSSRFDALDSLAGFMDHREVSLQVARRTSVDPDGIVEALAGLVRDPGLRRRMGEAGATRCRAYYAWPVIAAKHRDLLRELSAARPRRARPDAGAAAPWAHDHARIFGHYPTVPISDDEPVTPARGEPFSGADNPVFPVVNAETGRLLRRVVRAAGRRGATVARCAAAAGTAPERARATVALALKYGLIREAS